MTEYIEAAIGYDASGVPASSSQFTFGRAPFSIADTERIEDLAEITTIVQGDPVVDIKVIDNIAMVSFDFAIETETLTDFVQELEIYDQEKTHVTNSINRFMDELALAERNNDEKSFEDVQLQIRSLSVPFMLPTISPVCFGGSVQVGFVDDPKFIFMTSDKLNQMPTKITMIFDMSSVFCQDELGVYTGTTEEEIRAQQEEMWYMDEAKKMEEANYRAMYGETTSLYDQYSEEEDTDKRLRGVRIK